MVPNIKTVEMPAPTAASVNATSTASQVINNRADNRLNTPERATMANKLRVFTTDKAVTINMLKSDIFIKVSILYLLFWEVLLNFLYLAFVGGFEFTLF